MQFTLTADPKVNPTGARSCPQGFGRFVDVEPGDTFDVFDVALVSNPTFRDTGLFVPADAEAEAALLAAQEAAKPEPTEAEEVELDADGEPVQADPGEDPVLAALRQEAADRAEEPAAVEPAPASPTAGASPFSAPPAGDTPPVGEQAPAAEPASPAPAPAPVAADTPAAPAEDTTTARAPRVRKEA